jgi:hypothetical protein
MGTDVVGWRAERGWAALPEPIRLAPPVPGLWYNERSGRLSWFGKREPKPEVLIRHWAVRVGRPLTRRGSPIDKP